MKPIPPKPPVKILGVSYNYITDPSTCQQETDFIFRKRILEEVEKVHGFPILRIFSIFDKKIGLKPEFDRLVNILNSFPKEAITLGFNSFLDTCQDNEKEIERIRTFFLNSLNVYIKNSQNRKEEQKATVEVFTKTSQEPIFLKKAEDFYVDYLKYQYGDNYHYFLNLYSCPRCKRIVNFELDSCHACDLLLNWLKVEPTKFQKIKSCRKDIFESWDKYSQKYKTKNYGEWPIDSLEKCDKCVEGTLFLIDEKGEEYTDYCSCRLGKNLIATYRSKLISAGIPRDYWGLTTDSYVNPSKFSYDRVVNEENLRIIKNYIDNIDSHISQGRGLYLYGDNNTGKTMFLCIVLKEAIKRGYNVIFRTMSEIINGYIQNWFEKKDISSFKTCDILGVDDSFDRRKTYTSESKMQISQIDDLFRHRAHNWKPILISANIASTDLSSKDSILNLNLVNLLNRKLLQLTLRGDFSTNLQDKLKKELSCG